ncbi:MAG: methyl-accepting chemotaxis protein [Gallionella sp.]|nr:methyl-accepting chemotaxis protein [Gallionella sp.]MDP1941423.1 methyl-accepting chemotaxis protein [Gallionella sp.]
MAFKISNSTTGSSSAQESNSEHVPPHKKHSFAKQLRLLIGCVAASFLLGIAATVIDYRMASSNAHYLDLSSNLVALTQQLAKDAGAALQGKQTAINGLPQTHKDIERILLALDKGDDIAPAISGEARTVLEQLLPISVQSLQHIKAIEKELPGILAVSDATNTLRKIVPAMRSVAARLPSSGASDKLTLLVDRINYDASSILNTPFTDEIAASLTSNLALCESILNGIDKSNQNAVELTDMFKSFRAAINDVIAHTTDLKNANNAAEKYFNSVNTATNGPFSAASTALKNSFDESLQGRWSTYVMALSAILLLTFVWLLSRLYLAEARHRTSIAEANTKLNQHAILRLMNELSDLAEGDLTVRATVTEDITGAVADSVNYTTEELHKLVSRITEAAEQMGMATRDSETMAQRLLASTQLQVKEITSAEESVKLISRSISEVDTAAIKAAEVGRQTLAATNQGSVAVSNTIAGMNDIRAHIQETSKRIKRLGESSQEIGEIVDLISDITEQTNVLALNAAIQAASAGDAGRGFSVVAEEVQRLAERSGEATKQIAALVKTIQSDTQDAVAAMEKSTLGVVEGAKLSEVAGQSLKEIELVSNELTALINSISVSTQVQTEMADEVSTIMQDIMSISEQTTEGTRLTSDSAARLTSLAVSLKGSVASFKL